MTEQTSRKLRADLTAEQREQAERRPELQEFPSRVGPRGVQVHPEPSAALR